jgi:hypothetical protein
MFYLFHKNKKLLTYSSEIVPYSNCIISVSTTDITIIIIFILSFYLLFLSYKQLNELTYTITGSVPSNLITESVKTVIKGFSYRETSFLKFIFDSINGVAINHIQDLQNNIINIIQDTLPNIQYEIISTCNFNTNYALSLDNAITSFIGSATASNCIIKMSELIATKQLNDNIYLINKLNTIIITKSNLMHIYFNYGISGVATSITYVTYKSGYKRLKI